MDDLGRPWPSLGPEGHRLVPTPGLDDLRKACWQVKGTFRCPVGYLLGALEVFGLVE